MISKKIHNSGIFNFEDECMHIHEAIDQFNKIDCKFIFDNVNELDQFDKYIINYFYEGIRGE